MWVLQPKSTPVPGRARAATSWPKINRLKIN